MLAEQRKKAIQESKYLGGDMEHTHLVKGLDYALLQKVMENKRKMGRVGERRTYLDLREKEREQMYLRRKGGKKYTYMYFIVILY